MYSRPRGEGGRGERSNTVGYMERFHRKGEGGWVGYFCHPHGMRKSREKSIQDRINRLWTERVAFKSNYKKGQEKGSGIPGRNFNPQITFAAGDFGLSLRYKKGVHFFCFMFVIRGITSVISSMWMGKGLNLLYPLPYKISLCTPLGSPTLTTSHT